MQSLLWWLSTLNPNPELSGLGRIGLVLFKNLHLQAHLECRRLKRESPRYLVLHGRLFYSRNALPSKNPQYFS